MHAWTIYYYRSRTRSSLVAEHVTQFVKIAIIYYHSVQEMCLFSGSILVTTTQIIYLRNAQDRNGDAALHIAMRIARSPQTMSLLLGGGADDSLCHHHEPPLTVFNAGRQCYIYPATSCILETPSIPQHDSRTRIHTRT